MKRYLANFWLASDIWLNTVFGGDVETMSSNMGRKLKEGRPCRFCSLVCWLLSRFWPDHCLHNIMNPVNKP
jgi:hypothetical protein